MNILSELRRSPGFISRYEIGDVLGAGGMGEVYLAFDTYRECDVAIKVALNAPGGGVDERIRKLWQLETRIAGRLKHPYVVMTHEAVTVEHLSYLVMEYVQGGTLKKYATAENLLPIERVVDLTFKVARALEYANTMGLLHRDIKPANILLTPDGSPKVSDFGAAYMTGVEMTQVFDVGTLPYMPPETFSGKAPTLQSDIYGVGVMAYELLTGSWPFAATSQAAMIYQKSQGEPAPLEAKRPDLPAALIAAVNRAMHRDLDVRYPSWSSLCDDLGRLMPGIHVESEVVMESAQFELFRATAFFAEFSETELWEAVRICRARRVAADAAIFTEGSSGCSMYVLTIGELDVVSRGVLLGKVHAGECFGELAFVHSQDHKRTATLLATTPSSFVEFSAESMQFASPSLQAVLGRAIMRTLVERIRSTDENFVNATLGQAFGT
jgi:eukaryotic-like serine/threonine-protein kinase